MGRLIDVKSIKVDDDTLNVEPTSCKDTGNEKILKVIGDVKPGEICTYWSNGDWSLWELVDYLLTKLAPADLYIATWSISELSARKLAQWLEDGRIKKLIGVIDFRSKNRHPAAYHLSKNIFTDIKLANCHAKVTVIVGQGEFISINGSANWTENPRLESGVITNSIKTGMANINLIEEVVRRGEWTID